MKKLLAFIIIGFSFLISCGPSKAELEARVKKELSNPDTIHNSYHEFYNDEYSEYRPFIKVKRIKVDSCEWLIFYVGTENERKIFHDPHCKKVETSETEN